MKRRADLNTPKTTSWDADDLLRPLGSTSVWLPAAEKAQACVEHFAKKKTTQGWLAQHSRLPPSVLPDNNNTFSPAALGLPFWLVVALAVVDIPL